MFNKSHSIAYAVLCLQTAYLKAHYPVHFYKALLNINKDDNGKINKFIVDAQNFGIEVKCPNINKSEGGFTIDNNSVLFGFEAIRGLGESVSNKILDERNSNNKFLNLNDFLDRVKPSEAQIVSLIKSGAIPTKNKRNSLINYSKKAFNNSDFKEVKSLPTLTKLKEEWGIDIDIIKTKEERLQIYNKLRQDKYDKYKVDKFNTHMNNFSEKHLQNEEMWEFETLSIFLSNNPFIEVYEKIKSFDEVEDGDKGVLVGVISKVVKKKDKNKNQFAYITMYSAMGIIEITCWSSQFSKYQDIIKKDAKLSMLCSKRDGKAFVNKIKTYEQWLQDINF